MFAVETLGDVPVTLARVYASRLLTRELPAGYEELRGPVGLFLIRRDGAAGESLANEVVGSFGNWDTRSGYAFDAVFLGWGFEGGPVFTYQMFGRCIDDLELALDWNYSGGACLLLTDFVYDVKRNEGRLDFSRTIHLDLSELQIQKKLTQLSSLMEELIRPARAGRSTEPEKSVWEISDYVAFLRTRRWAWETMVKKLGALLGWADEIKPYAVRDLRRHRNS